MQEKPTRPKEIDPLAGVAKDPESYNLCVFYTKAHHHKSLLRERPSSPTFPTAENEHENVFTENVHRAKKKANKVLNNVSLYYLSFSLSQHQD